MTAIICRLFLLPELYTMIWVLAILLLLLIIICWLLIASFQLEIDTRVPMARFNWHTIGHAQIFYDDHWLLQFQILFYRRQFALDTLKNKKIKKKAAVTHKKKAKRMKLSRLLKKGKRILNSFVVKEWRLAVDTGDFARNAQLYPLNFISRLYPHLQINFKGENYMVLKLQNRAWKIIYALLR
jgi:hypothetical protein